MSQIVMELKIIQHFSIYNLFLFLILKFHTLKSLDIVETIFVNLFSNKRFLIIVEEGRAGKVYIGLIGGPGKTRLMDPLVVI